MESQLQPGDIFFTRGTGFLAKAIRFFTRNIGEQRSRVNHVGIVAKEGGSNSDR
jgi:cell wall-associated NlpC family hydrolase